MAFVYNCAMMVKNLLFLILLVFFANSVFSQITFPGEPFSENYKLNKSVIYSTLPLMKVTQPSSPKREGLPMLAGYVLAVVENIKPEWEQADEKQFVARLGFAVDGAKGVNLYFSDFSLNESEQVFIYNPSKNKLIGALTNKNNAAFLASAFVEGDSLVLEFNTNRQTDAFPFKITEVGISVTDMYKGEGDFGDAGDCEILVNCPEGDDWKKERDGVARVLVKEGSSLYWCSGSLVNNTKQDGKPYFLTANHCGKNAIASDYNQWVFYFNYESPDCQFPPDEPVEMSTSGAKLVARASGGTSGGSDFKLLLLNDEVPKSYHPYYNGWNRSPVPSNSGVGIHHPEGDLKMISTYLNPLVSADYLETNSNPDGYYWKVNWSPTEGGHGVTEGGSSGSPLFNSQGQIVGSLTGGSASCLNTYAPDYYGKFSYSWDSNGTDSTSQLSVWLSPGNPEIEFLNGTDLDTSGISANFRAEYNDILVGETVTFINNSSGNISQYKWHFPGASPDFSESKQPPSIQYDQAGIYDVKLEVSSVTGQDQLTRFQYIRVSPAITQNPAEGRYTLNFGKLVPDDLYINVFDVNGRNIDFFTEEKVNSVVVSLSPFADGIYFIRTETGTVRQSYKVMLNRSFK